MQHIALSDELGPVDGPPERSPSTKGILSPRRAVHFVNWDRELQLQAFFAWLPKELHAAPGIDWTQLPGKVMRYCVYTIGGSPDAAVLALAAASAHGAIAPHSLLHYLKRLYRLFQTLRSTCQMTHLTDLLQERMWYDWLDSRKKTEGTRNQLQAYAAVATGHFPRYLSRLEEEDRLRMQRYAFPPLPPDMTKKQLAQKQVRQDQQVRRKEQSDILVPLYPVLRQLVRFRKQVAERLLVAIREARRKVEAGEAVLPFRFAHTDAISEVNRDARTIADVQLVGQQVTMHFLLWDKRTWVEHHPDRYCDQVVDKAKTGKQTYTPEQNCYFVQFDGKASDLLWFGDLMEHRLLQRFKTDHSHQEGYPERLRLARQLGFSRGCDSDRPGLLCTGERWFSDVGHRNGDFVFEPEALYRGVVFGAALAMIALSNGSRVSELLQVSWNKERRVTRTETVKVLGEDGQPLRGEGGKPLAKQVKIYLQHLLPKGAKSEEERQLFPLSQEAMRLLGEIKTMLEEAHGEIPVVYPSRTNTKYEDLKPERYLFQWATTPDGQQGSLSTGDVQVLLRFILHGLELTTAQGKPIRVSTHLLRHVMATHARQYRHVPPEAIAYFFLHHRLTLSTGREPSLSAVSDYYFQMTEEQRFAIIRADLEEQEEMDRTLMQMAPSPRDLEQKNEDLQAVYDEWQTLHPTALGNCGCPGLCPRGVDRALCIGCSYLVEDPERMGAALAWRVSYAKQAELLEAQGNVIDARQARFKVQKLDDHINVMRLQLQAEADGRYIPLYKILPSPRRKGGGEL